MPKAEATVDLTRPAAAVRARLLDHAGWSEWMPGVVAARVLDADTGHVQWDVMTPTGAAPVRLHFQADTTGVSFRGAGAPFTLLAGRVNVDDRRVRFEMTLEGAPVPVDLLVQQACFALATATAGDGPELLAVPMSDGPSLAVHRYPAATSPAGAVLVMIPYRKDSVFSADLASLVNARGLDFLIADVRGFGGSVAEYEGQFSEREIQDGVELIEWIARQPWCTGRVGLTGASYCGLNQMLVAARRPKGLVCISPVVGPVDTYRDMWHRGGIPSHTRWGAMTYLRAQQRATMRTGLEHFYLDVVLDDCDNDRHRARSAEYVLDRIEVPVLAVGGWHDYFLRGTVRTFLGVQSPKRLIVGPWGHGDAPPPDLFDWLDHHVNGKDGIPEGPPVRLFTTGAETWHDRVDWPDPASSAGVRWNPAPEGADLRVLTHLEAAGMAPNVRRQFVPDPTDSGMSLWAEDAVFDGEPFAAPATVEGPIGLTLALTVDGCEDVDVHARVSVVDGDGTVTQLTEGRLRASHRAIDRARSRCTPDGDVVVPWHLHEDPEPLPNGEPVELHIEIDPISHQFSAGDRLRLGLTLARADEGAVPTRARLLGETRLLLPLAD